LRSRTRRSHDGREVLREVPSDGSQQRRPDADRPDPGDGPGHDQPDPDNLGDALLSHCGQADGCIPDPPVGSGAWVEFEQGDSDYPTWTGCYYGTVAEVPALALAGIPDSSNIVFQTTAQNALVVSDLPGPTGGIMLKSTTGVSIIVNDTGIYIQNGKGASIVMTGATVTVNNGALVVE
jgi:hypothetical protein